MDEIHLKPYFDTVISFCTSNLNLFFKYMRKLLCCSTTVIIEVDRVRFLMVELLGKMTFFESLNSLYPIGEQLYNNEEDIIISVE